MIKVLLVTTGENNVRKYLEDNKCIHLQVMDVNDFADVAKHVFLMELEETIKRGEAELMITWRCPYVLPQSLFGIPKYGAYNIHPSLLPKYRGLDPWVGIFRNKEVENGVTLHRIANVVDGGEILYQQSYPISPDDNVDTARNNADVIAARLLDRFFNEYYHKLKLLSAM